MDPVPFWSIPPLGNPTKVRVSGHWAEGRLRERNRETGLRWKETRNLSGENCPRKAALGKLSFNPGVTLA